MPRIIDGDIVADDDPRVLARENTRRRRAWWKYLRIPLLILLLFAFQQWWTVPKDNALNQGGVPAHERSWDRHWNYIRQWKSFTRDMTSHESWSVRLIDGLSSILYGHGTYATLEDAASERKSDYGGRGVPKPEGGRVGEINNFEVTRCSSTRYAVTAYYCGLDVANNANANADTNAQLQMLATSSVGVRSLEKYLTNWEMDTKKRLKKNDTSLRVLRLGVGQQVRGDPAQEHVWSVRSTLFLCQHLHSSNTIFSHMFSYNKCNNRSSVRWTGHSYGGNHTSVNILCFSGWITLVDRYQSNK